VSTTTTKKHPRYSEARRIEALAIYRETSSYRRTAERLGCSHKRARELVRDALKLEMAAARKHDEGSTTK
jgi:molybdenum-dependent DNA-binding transcriptional regulator ModE